MTDQRGPTGYLRFTVTALVSPLVVPAAVFLAVGVASGMGVGGAVDAFVQQSGERRQNPMVTGALGLFPVLLLGGGLAVGARLSRRRGWVRPAAWSGLAAILAVLGWANFEFWPDFLPERVYPGFPHGLELVIAPVFFAPVAAAMAVFMAVMLSRRAETSEGGTASGAR